MIESNKYLIKKNICSNCKRNISNNQTIYFHNDKSFCRKCCPWINSEYKDFISRLNTYWSIFKKNKKDYNNIFISTSINFFKTIKSSLVILYCYRYLRYSD